MPNDWSAEETDDPLHADRRNFRKVERWGKDGAIRLSLSEHIKFAGGT
jgi:hypothetical protein